MMLDLKKKEEKEEMVEYRREICCIKCVSFAMADLCRLSNY